ncbi:NADPH HC-toxin reductase 1-like [Primulina eburnea]|uniref:NADPH HC-toxin reductase 1-like n=1 Tax=Primulina eburnea TaxID=1245227 RepID=UPI003C6C9C0C
MRYVSSATLGWKRKKLISTIKQHDNRLDATVVSARSIASLCIRSVLVRRLIYTASVVAASPLKEDGNGYKEFMDETCWTSLIQHLSECVLRQEYDRKLLQEYTLSKTLADMEILGSGNGKIEVVTLACGLVGGGTLMPSTPGSLQSILEELLARVPIVHTSH